MRRGYVYIISAKWHGFKKIGYSTDPETRARALATGAGPVWIEEIHQGGEDLEAYLHKALASYRVDGEWFDLPEDWPAIIAHHTNSYRKGIPPSQSAKDLSTHG